MALSHFDQAAWRSFVEHHPLPTTFVDRTGRYLFANKAYEAWAMTKREDLVGRTIEEVMGKAASQAVATHVETALAGATVRFESSIPYQRRGTRRMKVTLTGMRDDSGAVAGFFAILEDVTTEYEAEAAIAAALERLGDGYLAVNNQYAFTYVNSGAARFYGLPRERMVGRKIEDLFPGSMATESGKMLVEVMTSRVPQRKEMASAGSPGRRFLMDIVPTTTGGVGVVIQDTTDWPQYGPAPAALPPGLITIRPDD